MRGRSVLGGSVLGGSVLGRSVLGRSVLGRSALGRSVRGRSVLVCVVCLSVLGLLWGSVSRVWSARVCGPCVCCVFGFCLLALGIRLVCVVRVLCQIEQFSSERSELRCERKLRFGSRRRPSFPLRFLRSPLSICPHFIPQKSNMGNGKTTLIARE